MADGDANVSEAVARELLERCAVRIQIEGRNAGTGFFVASGMVVTCEHVLEARERSSGRSEIAIIDSEGRTYDLGDIRERSSVDGNAEDDLAILRVKGSDEHYGSEHPCA